MMVAFQHPLGLFRLEHTPAWGAGYDADSGTLVLQRSGAEGQSALHFIPLAVTGASAAPDRLLFQHAQRLGAWLPPDSVTVEERERFNTAYGEARRPTLGEGAPSQFRFWVASRKGLSVVITQLGPATADPEVRAEADAIVQSLELPEVIPPTPAEFLTTLLTALRQTFPRLVETVTGEWEVEIRDENGKRIATLDLGPPYAAVLHRPRDADRIARELLSSQLPERAEDDAEPANDEP
jgi:hypothetical protein